MRDEITAYARWPRFWRMLLIGLCALILCSCRGPAGLMGPGSVVDGATPLSLPPEAYMGQAAGAYAAGVPCEVLPGMEQGVPLAYGPPTLGADWPRDEYLRDGGDRGLPAEVTADWEVLGLETEDTIVHYDTIDGERAVEPSNTLAIYSPRFGSVRKVVSLKVNDQPKHPADVFQPMGLVDPTTTQIVAGNKQHVQVRQEISGKQVEAFRTKVGDGALSGAERLEGFQNKLLPYETENLIGQGLIEMADMPFLARSAAAADVWSRNQAVQIILDDQKATVETADVSVAKIHTIDHPPGTSELRVVKLASTHVAEPGDEIDFTIRFDNVGTNVIGNVTIIDNLTTRLEYVHGSGQCSLDAEFFTQPNEGDSLVIRCEVTDPLEPGDGGVVRFRCRVR